MLIKDGVVSYIGVEGSGEFGKSTAETLLAELKKA
jgi:peroxiredoxin